MLAEAVVDERRALRDTLQSVGAGASTIIKGWTAHDIAAHVLSLDRFRGVPTFIGRTVVTKGVRLNDVAGRFAEGGLRSSKRRGYAWALDQLERPPPSILLRPSVVTVGLFEVYVHHEDVRRANKIGESRVVPDALAAVVPWLLRYHRRLLSNVRLVVRTSTGEWAEGDGPAALLEGPVGEVVLWLAGRRDVSEVELTGVSAEAVEAIALHI